MIFRCEMRPELKRTERYGEGGPEFQSERSLHYDVNTNRNALVAVIASRAFFERTERYEVARAE